jgi:hypothetical protein
MKSIYLTTLMTVQDYSMFYNTSTFDDDIVVVIIIIIIIIMLFV